MSRLVDRGAIFAGWVGIGMAAVIVLSFVLVIPIQAAVFMTAPLAGLLIGYYADARSGRGRGAWGRNLANAAYAGALTGLSLAALYVGVRLIFVYGDDGYRNPAQGGRIACSGGPDCTYRRYLDDAVQAERLLAEGVTDAESFQAYFLRQQADAAATLVVLVLGSGLAGGVAYAATRPRLVAPN